MSDRAESAILTPRLRGESLQAADYAALEGSWITPELADQAMLRRVSSMEGAEIVGRRDNGSYSGIVFAYTWPGEAGIREYWLRRDRPEIRYDATGNPKEHGKYLGPPGRSNLLYITPGTEPQLLNDVGVPVVITEGAKKTLALHRLSRHDRATDAPPRFLPVGLSGVWSFTGKIGKVPAADGSARDEKGLIADLRRLAWSGRKVYVAYDSNVHTNPKVAAARRRLSTEMMQWGAEVYWVNMPKPGQGPPVNGIDDLLAAWGPEKVLELFNKSEAAPANEPEPSQARQLIELCDDVELFRTPDGEAYAHVLVDQHRETWMLRSKGFSRWLSRQFHMSVGKPPRAQALQEAVGLLEAKAQFESPEIPVWVRVGEHGGMIFLDLCNASWEAVEIGPNGWRVITDPPVRFRRSKGMQPLPRPTEGGSITLLRKFINVGSDDNWMLCLAWLVAALRPSGPYPILLLQGEQGSAKSTMAKLLRRITDPVVAPVRTPPRSDRDLLIAASNSWVIAYDNLSGVQHWLSDALCRLATGGGFSTRELYTDSDEVIFDAMRPVILNGIDHLAERADLAERSVILHLPRIPPEKRQDERLLYADFEREFPLIFGALLTAVSVALSRIDHVKLDSKPRMADFALWASAAAPGLGIDPEALLAAYRGNRAEAVEETLEGDVVASALLEWLGGQASDQAGCWEGTCKQLMPHLESIASETTRKSQAWPKTPRALSSRLRRIATFMREVGVEITFHPKSARGERRLSISGGVQTTAATAATAASDPLPPSIQSDAKSVPSGVVAVAPEDLPPPPQQPPPAGPLPNSFADTTCEGSVAVAAVAAVVFSDSSSPERKNVCASCGAVDWVWESGRWVCPTCHQPARS
jgi:hypothetical protein